MKKESKRYYIRKNDFSIQHSIVFSTKYFCLFSGGVDDPFNLHEKDIDVAVKFNSYLIVPEFVTHRPEDNATATGKCLHRCSRLSRQ